MLSHVEHDFMFDSIRLGSIMFFLRLNLRSRELGQLAQVRAFSPFRFAVREIYIL